MGKKQVPTASELREYLAKERAYLVDCVKNNKTFVITGELDIPELMTSPMPTTYPFELSPKLTNPPS